MDEIADFEIMDEIADNEKKLHEDGLMLFPEFDALESGLKLDVYIIDSGWDSVAHRVLEGAEDLFETYLSDHNLYKLTRDQSIELLRKHPDIIGKDPVVMVVDKLARVLENPSGYGARLMLGLVHDKQRVEWLIKMFLRVVNTHAETLDIAHTFQEMNYKEGIKGTVEIVMESIGTQFQAGH